MDFFTILLIGGALYLFSRQSDSDGETILPGADGKLYPVSVIASKFTFVRAGIFIDVEFTIQPIGSVFKNNRLFCELFYKGQKIGEFRSARNWRMKAQTAETQKYKIKIIGGAYDAFYTDTKQMATFDFWNQVIISGNFEERGTKDRIDFVAPLVVSPYVQTEIQAQ